MSPRIRRHPGEVKIVEAAWSAGLLVRAEWTVTVAHSGVVLARLLATRVGLTGAFRDVTGFIPDQYTLAAWRPGRSP